MTLQDGPDGTIKTCFARWPSAKYLEEPDLTVLEGTPTTELSTVHAAYNLGDFTYQIIDRDGVRRRVMNCRRPGERDWVVRKLEEGWQVVIKLSR